MLEFLRGLQQLPGLDGNERGVFALLAMSITGSTLVKYGEHELDFSKIQRLTMREAIVKYWPPEARKGSTLEMLASAGGAREAASRYNDWAKNTGAPYACFQRQIE